jgi:prepilin-type N-terminal cleavage/methylation domain-containing protein
MTAFSLYLSSPKTRAVLTRKPTDEGFSLIELVVVVAVLAILAAIAIPAFTSINDNAAQAAAKNTIAQIAKECAVKKANLEANPEFNVPRINGYTITPADGNCDGANDWLTATRNGDASDELPAVIRYNVETGVKNCTAGNNGDWCVNNIW